MKYTYHIKMRAALWAMLGVACLASAPAMAWDQNPQGKCVDPRGCGSSPSPSPGGGDTLEQDTRNERREQREEEEAEERERVQRDARYDAVHKRVDAALASGDYREALRLAREKQALRDGPKVRATIAALEKHLSDQAKIDEKYFSDQAKIDQGNRYNEQANSAKEKGDFTLALKLYQQALATLPNPTAEYRQFVADYEKYVDRQTKEREARSKQQAEDEALERRHRPEVERLRAEATRLIDKNPAQALAKLDAALALLPGDAKTSGDRWLAEASLALNAANYDAALDAVKKSEGYSPDAAELAKWNKRIKEERERQGAEVQNAFADLRQRLASPAGSIDPGAQLKSVEQSSNAALESPVAEKEFMTRGRADKQLAGDRFDRIGGSETPLVYPDKKQRQRPLSDLDKQIPGGAKDDPQIKKMQAWYWSLNGQKAEKQQKRADLVAQQKTRKDPSLAAKIATLDNDVKRLTDDQEKATTTVKDRVAVIRKRTLDKGLAWDEAPAAGLATVTETTKTPAPAAAKLNFIQD